ncbi:MAG: prolipoprotein diacylglyceryl transferase [Ruminiclostridium sp.]|nr:prolipoprotein diacylglyceryl transferase [Ruminiclostridium sp.]
MLPGITIFGRFISSYALAALVGVFAACPFAIFTYKKRTGDGYPMLAMLLISAVGIFAGGGLLYGITNIDKWYLLSQAKDFGEWWEYAKLIFGGSVFYGGLFGGMAVGAFVIKKRGYPADLMTDIAAPAVALFHGFGRIGCFLGGCCYGIEVPWGITFTHSLNEPANGVPRMPVQLFESGFEFLLFFVLWQLLRHDKLKGRLLSLYLIAYGIFRFLIEYFRGDTYRGFIFGMSTSQFISIFAVIGGAAYLSFKTLRRDHENQIE